VRTVLPVLSEPDRHAMISELWEDLKKFESSKYNETSSTGAAAFNVSDMVATYSKGSHNCTFPQAILRYGNDECKRALASAMTGHISDLALDEYGCFVVNEMLRSLPPHLRDAAVAEMLSDPEKVAAMAMSKCGNFPLQIVMETASDSQSATIGRAFEGRLSELATNTPGQFSVIKALKTMRKSTREPLVAELLRTSDDVVAIATDQYGTFVLQHLLDHGSYSEMQTIGHALRGRMFEVSPIVCRDWY
jgi:hypothetical protein